MRRSPWVCLLVATAALVFASNARAQKNCAPVVIAQDGTFLGKLSDNKFDPNSVSNPYGTYGTPYSVTSVRNPFGPYGSPYSAASTTNPYTTQAPKIVDPCTGKYLGQLSANPYAADSTANKYGRFGSPFSPDSISNPFASRSVAFPGAESAGGATGQLQTPVHGVDPNIYSRFRPVQVPTLAPIRKRTSPDFDISVPFEPVIERRVSAIPSTRAPRLTPVRPASYQLWFDRQAISLAKQPRVLPETVSTEVAPKTGTARRDSCGLGRSGATVTSVEVLRPNAPVFVQPRVLAEPLAVLVYGTWFSVVERAGDWFLIRFESQRWGRSVGYVYCGDVSTP